MVSIAEKQQVNTISKITSPPAAHRHGDVINYGNLPYTDFIRTQTLCQGGDKCDFCFIRHAKGEDWERTNSV